MEKKQSNEKSLLSKYLGQMLLALLWCILFGIAYGTNNYKPTKLKDAFEIASIICMCLNLLSIIYRFGLLENTVVSFKKSIINRPSKVKKRKLEGEVGIKEYTVKELRDEKKETPWTPILISTGIYTALLLVGVMI